MTKEWVAKTRALLFPEAEASQATDRSEYERFALPYAFKPRLSLLEAVIAATGAFLRILLGSLLFAFWGVYTLMAWSSIPNSVLRVAAMLPLVGLFLLTFALLMLGISVLVRTVSPKRP